MTGGVYLSRKARSELAAAIRKVRIEQLQLYVPWMMAVIAVLSLAVSFLALLRK